MQKNYGKAAREMRQQAEVFLNKKTEQSELCSSVVRVVITDLQKGGRTYSFRAGFA